MKVLDECFLMAEFALVLNRVFFLFFFSVFMFNVDRELSVVKGLKIYCIKLYLPGYKLSRYCMMDNIPPPPIPIVKPPSGL